MSLTVKDGFLYVYEEANQVRSQLSALRMSVEQRDISEARQWRPELIVASPSLDVLTG